MNFSIDQEWKISRVLTNVQIAKRKRCQTLCRCRTKEKKKTILTCIKIPLSRRRLFSLINMWRMKHTWNPLALSWFFFFVVFFLNTWNQLWKVTSSHSTTPWDQTLEDYASRLHCWSSGFQAFMGSSLTVYHLSIICFLRGSVSAPCLSELLQLLAAVTTPRSVNQLEVPKPKLKGRGDKVLSISPRTDAGTQ